MLKNSRCFKCYLFLILSVLVLLVSSSNLYSADKLKIVKINVSNKNPEIGETVKLSVEIENVAQKNVTYSWSCKKGEIIGDTHSAEVNYKPLDKKGYYKIKVWVQNDDTKTSKNILLKVGKSFFGLDLAFKVGARDKGFYKFLVLILYLLLVGFFRVMDLAIRDLLTIIIRNICYLILLFLLHSSFWGFGGFWNIFLLCLISFIFIASTAMAEQEQNKDGSLDKERKKNIANIKAGTPLFIIGTFFILLIVGIISLWIWDKVKESQKTLLVTDPPGATIYIGKSIDSLTVYQRAKTPCKLKDAHYKDPNIYVQFKKEGYIDSDIFYLAESGSLEVSRMVLKQKLIRSSDEKYKKMFADMDNAKKEAELKRQRDEEKTKLESKEDWEIVKIFIGLIGLVVIIALIRIIYLFFSSVNERMNIDVNKFVWKGQYEFYGSDDTKANIKDTANVKIYDTIKTAFYLCVLILIFGYLIVLIC